MRPAPIPRACARWYHWSARQDTPLTELIEVGWTTREAVGD
jgi:hypothetical protein